MNRRSVKVAVFAPVAAALLFAGCGIAPEYAAFELPPEAATYTYQVERHGTHTTWTFESEQVTERDLPPGYACPEEVHQAWGSTEELPPCAAQPLLFLRYDAGVDLTNSVPAPGAHRITVEVTRQNVGFAPVEGLSLWTSTDSGKHWAEAKVRALGRDSDGEQSYTALARYPRASQTDGAVWLKAVAWDADGNRVEQVVEDAFYLTDRTDRGET